MGRIIKNLAFSVLLVGLMGMVTGIGLLVAGSKLLAVCCLLVGIFLFAASFLACVYYHKRNVHVEPWGFCFGLGVFAALFVSEIIFFSFFFALRMVISALIIVFLYAFIVRRIRKIK